MELSPNILVRSNGISSSSLFGKRGLLSLITFWFLSSAGQRAIHITRMTVLWPYRTPYRTVEHLQLYYYGTVTGDPYPSTTRNFYGRTRIWVRWASLVTSSAQTKPVVQKLKKAASTPQKGMDVSWWVAEYHNLYDFVSLRLQEKNCPDLHTHHMWKLWALITSWTWLLQWSNFWACYMHAMDLCFTLTSSIDFNWPDHSIRPLWPPAAYHLCTLFDISFPFHFTISHIKSRIQIR